MHCRVLKRLKERLEIVMSEWKEVRLGSCIETNKQSIGKNYPFADILYLDTGSITANRIEKLQGFSVFNAPSRAKRLVEEGNIIYSSVRPNQLHYGFIKNPKDNLVVSTGFVVISCDKDKIQPKYLFYFLSSDNSTEYLHSIAEASTSAYPSLKPSDIEALEIYLPPLPEQKAIAEVLSSLDDKIDLLHRQNKTLEQMAETLFRQWFMEEAKEGWEEGVLGDILSIIESGKRPKGGIDQNLKSGIPSIGAESINGIGNFSFSSTKYVTEDFFNSLKRGIVEDFDVLIYKDGAYIGKKAMFGLGFPFRKFAVNEHVFILRSNKKSNQYFLYFLLQQSNLVMLNANSAQPGLNQNSMKNFEISIPPKGLIDVFGSTVKPYIEKILRNAVQIRTLEKIRDTLLPKLMSGEVKVKI